MEFDDAKENIQPLARGRDVSILHASITHTPKELNEQRRELEATIHAYDGDDPLEPWYNYVSWIEQMFPSGGKESGLMQVLSKCLRNFESEERYYQDRRMIKLFIKFLYSNKDPLECFQQLFNAGIGTMVADFYIAWAYCYDSVGQMEKADEIFRRGVECRAEPLNELKDAYHHFKIAVGERILYKDKHEALQNTNRQLEERRLALSSLRGYRKHKGIKEVGSIRTGAAIKSYNPGTVQNDSGLLASTSANSRVAILKDENIDPNPAAIQLTAEAAEEIKSSNVIRSIVDNTRHQENEHEPGPWNKVHDKKNEKKLMRQKRLTHDIGFSIHEDIEVEDDQKIKDETFNTIEQIILPDADKHYEKPFKYPPNFVSRNRRQPEWVLPVTAEVEPDARSFPCYKKCMLYPRPNREFQKEEYMAFRFYEKRGIKNALTKRYDSVWSVNDINAHFRMYPNFARQSNPQKLDDLDAFHMEPHIEGMFMQTAQIYDENLQEEFQLEELMAREWFNSKNRTVIEPQDMDETNCASSSHEQVQRRKSFFPMRRSLAIRRIVTETVDSFQLPNDKTEKQAMFDEEKHDDIVIENQVIVGAAAVISPQQRSTSSISPAISDNMPTMDKAYTANPVLDSPAKSNNPSTDTNAETAIPTTKEAAATNKENDFSFKLPALPIKSSKPQHENAEAVTSVPSAVVSKKLPFEIFVEEAASSLQPTIGAIAPVKSSFDPEETCSTQMFNICLKSQSASTPKHDQKSQKRQFNVLREVEQPKPTSPAAAVVSISSSNSSASPSESAVLTAPSYSLSPQSPVSPDNDLVCNFAAANSYSPPIRKQLSTILETSEHGIHSAATTKSSSGTNLSEISEGTAACQTQKTQMEVVENTQATQEVVTLMAGVQIVGEQQVPNRIINTTTQAVVSASQKSPAETMKTTIGLSQSQNKSQTSGTITDVAKKTFMETNEVEPEVAKADSFQKIQKPSNLKFSIFEDPTDTVPKLTEHISAGNAVAGNFDRLIQCNDSTLNHLAMQPIRFERDQTETNTKFVGAPFYPEEKTETLPFNILNKNDKQIMDTTKKSVRFCEDEYDTEQFFQKSPLKGLAIAPKKEANQKSFNIHLTPLNDTAAKRICVQETPGELQKAAPATGKNLLETFINDFSLLSNSQTQFANKPTTMMQRNCEPVPEFSYVEDTQPTNAVAEQMPVRNTFASNEVSFVEETQPPAVKKTETEKTKNDIEDSLIILETQENQKNTTASKGAIPKMLQLNKSKLHDSSKESFFSNIKTQSKKVDPLLSRVENSTILKDFSIIDGNQGTLKENKTLNLTTSLLNNSNRGDASFGPDMRLKQGKQNDLPHQQQFESSFSMLDLTKANETKERADKLMNSFLMDTSSSATSKTTTTTATNKKTKLVMEVQTKATPKVNELLESFNKTSMFDLSQKVGVIFKQPNASVRESLIPKLDVNKLRTQANNRKSNEPNSFLTTASKCKTNQWPTTPMSNKMAIFDLNAESDTFANGINMLKNSTMFSDTPIRQSDAKQSFIQEPSLHIKTEAATLLPNVTKKSSLDHTHFQSSKNNSRSSARSLLMPEADDEMSIYYRQTPRTPQLNEHNNSWSNDSDDMDFVHKEVDLNETAQLIETKCIDPYVNPFDADLINAFLDNVEFISFLKREPNTMLVGNIKRLHQNSILEIKDVSFKIGKVLGQGNYGTVFSGVDMKTHKKYALKQERPPNYWEYYICLIVQERIKNDDILLSYMKIECAQIGNNASVFVSAFAPYGSIIEVCNKIKKKTTKNVDEYVVMHLTCELLEIIDHLHAAEIIHADLKPDNFLLMNKLAYNSKTTSLHLIDFGVSIDMRQFKKSQVFTFVHNQDAFKCIEMREERPWTYQLDLYGLAGVIHVLLFGKYMEVEKNKTVWLPKQHMPRYIHKILWEHIFRTLLNIRDCRSMPDMQKLRQLLKQEMAEKEPFVINKIAEFNKALDA